MQLLESSTSDTPRIVSFISLALGGPLCSEGQEGGHPYNSVQHFQSTSGGFDHLRAVLC